MSFLQINNINKSFGNTQVLDNINFEAKKGEFVVLVGPSGCGKSTILNIVAGLINPTSGEIVINDKKMNSVSPSQRDIAMVFQSYALYPNMTVAQNISFGLEMKGVPKAERIQKTAEVARTLQIEALLNRKPAQLSGGQRQRVAMGRAMVRNPQVFLFDEPLSNLDAKLRVEMRAEIKRLYLATGTTMIYVTHDQIEAMTLSTHILVLKDGIMQQYGTPKDIYNTPANTFVADFMGSPSMNIFKCRLSSKGNSLKVTTKNAEKQEVVFNLIKPSSKLKKYINKDILVGIRPEDIHYGGKTTNLANCLIELVDPIGSDTYVITQLAGASVTAKLRADVDIKENQKAPLSFDMARASFFDCNTKERIN